MDGVTSQTFPVVFQNKIKDDVYTNYLRKKIIPYWKIRIF